MRRLPALLAAAAVIAACGHGDPWTFDHAPLTAPRQPGPVARLTYNPGDDLDPAWFPDGSSFVYTTERRDRRDADHCVAVMGIEGGTLRGMLCERRPASDANTDIFSVATPGPDGRVAVLYTIFDLFVLRGYYGRVLLVDSLDALLTFRRVPIAYPYRAAGGFTHDGIAEIAWRSPTQLAYLATLPNYPLPCKTCRRDAATPVQVVLVDLAGDTAVTQAVPNTTFATSIAVQGPDTLYFTLMGDGRVFRRVLSSGEETVVRDYGSAIARDVQVTGRRLVAIVGGQVLVELLTNIGYVQNDDGGEVHVLDLASGMETVVAVPTGRLFRRAALSPDGRTLLAESRASPADNWDIWMVGLP